MGTAVELICPLCQGDAIGGASPADGRCLACGAHYAGGGSSAPEGVARALEVWGLGDLPAERVARRLFEVEPHPAPRPTVAVTSDRRDDFYLWWVFVRAGADGRVRPVVEELLG